MAIDSAQKRMSALNPACPWRGPLVDAAESGFSAGNRGASDFLYSGLVDTGGGGNSTPIGFFPHRYFALRYFPDRYFPGTGGAAGVTWYCEAGDVWLAGCGSDGDVWLAGPGEDAEVFVAGILNDAGEVIPL